MLFSFLSKDSIKFSRKCHARQITNEKSFLFIIPVLKELIINKSLNVNTILRYIYYLIKSFIFKKLNEKYSANCKACLDFGPATQQAIQFLHSTQRSLAACGRT
jgi:hypothetical protein